MQIDNKLPEQLLPSKPLNVSLSVVKSDSQVTLIFSDKIDIKRLQRGLEQKVVVNGTEIVDPIEIFVKGG